MTEPINVADYFERAAATVEPKVWCYFEGGAGDEILVGAAVVHPKRHELVRKGKSYTLSFYEVELLRMLFERAGQPVTREELLEKIWGISGHASTRSVDNFIVKLRKKIEENAAKPEHIVTIYGTGYKLVV